MISWLRTRREFCEFKMLHLPSGQDTRPARKIGPCMVSNRRGPLLERFCIEYLTTSQHLTRHKFICHVLRQHTANDARPGKRCFEEAIAPALDTAARLLHSGSDGPKHVLVIDLHAWGWRDGYSPFYNGANGLIWAKLEPLAGRQWRAQIDVSVPPPPHHVGMPVAPLFNATAQQLAEVAAWEPPSEYEVFVSFKGRFSTNGVRPVLGRLHDPTQGVVIVNSENILKLSTEQKG